MKRFFLSLCLLSFILLAQAQTTTYDLQTNISYRNSKGDAYQQERCVLDLYVPKGKKDFVTILWFHGGGLTAGKKEIPEYLKEKGVAVLAVGYRLAPKVKVAEIIQDAAWAVKWAYEHIEEYGGSKNKLILSGHSAGGYLNLMLALNPAYLLQVGVPQDALLGVVPFSPQCITHFTARAEQNISDMQPLIDELAPLFWVRKDAPPITLITGDRELEMIGRYEENAYLARMLKLVGHQHIKLLELDGYDHNMVYPGLPLLLKELQGWSK